MSARRRTDIGIAIAAILMLVALLLAAQTEQDHGLQLQTGLQAVNCQEDESWVAVHHATPNAIEDMHGVSRMCQAVDG